jgi:hypothetical protein
LIDKRLGCTYPISDSVRAAEAQLPGSSKSCSAIPVQPHLPTNTCFEYVRLLDTFGHFVREIEASEARTMIRERKAVGLGTKQVFRAVQLIVDRKQVEDHGVPCRPLLPSGLVGQRYSDKHAHDDNPENVWRLKQLRARDVDTDLHIHSIYIQSLTDCMGATSKAELLAQLKQSKLSEIDKARAARARRVD